MSMLSVSSSGSLYEKLTKDSINVDNSNKSYRRIDTFDEEFEEMVSDYMKRGPQSSSIQVTASIVYSMINPLLICLPMAAHSTGIPIFIFLIAVISSISAYSNCLIVNMAVDSKVTSFEALGDKAFGIKGYLLICMLQILYSITLMYISLSVWGDVTSSIIVTDLPNIDQQISKHITTDSLVLYIGALIVSPFCFARRSMTSLQWTSYAVILAITTALLSVVIAFSSNAARVQTINNPYKNVLKPTNDWWIAVFVITYCFAYNQKVFVIHSCLRINEWRNGTTEQDNNMSKKWSDNLKKAHFIVSILYVIFGIFGCLSILDAGSEFSTNYFLESNDFSSSNKLFFNILRFVVSLSILLTFPGNVLAAATTAKRMLKRLYLKEITSCTLHNSRSTSINSNGPLSPQKDNTPNFKYNLISNDDIDSNIDFDRSPGSQLSVNRISSHDSEPINISINRITDDLSDSTRNSNRNESTNDSEGGKSTASTVINFSKGVLPGLFFLGLALVLALNLESTSMEIAFIGSITTCLLLFLLPSMLYFRLGLKSDFGSVPIISVPILGSIIPNYLFMYILQIIGIIFLCGEFGLLIYIMLPGTNNNIFTD